MPRMEKVNVARRLMVKNLNEHAIYERDETLATIDTSVTNLGMFFSFLKSNKFFFFKFEIFSRG